MPQVTHRVKWFSCGRDTAVWRYWVTHSSTCPIWLRRPSTPTLTRCWRASTRSLPWIARSLASATASSSDMARVSVSENSSGVNPAAEAFGPAREFQACCRRRSRWVVAFGAPVGASAAGRAIQDEPKWPHEVDMAHVLAGVHWRHHQLAAPEVVDLSTAAGEDGGDGILAAVRRLRLVVDVVGVVRGGDQARVAP